VEHVSSAPAEPVATPAPAPAQAAPVAVPPAATNRVVVTPGANVARGTAPGAKKAGAKKARAAKTPVVKTHRPKVTSTRKPPPAKVTARHHEAGTGARGAHPPLRPVVVPPRPVVLFPSFVVLSSPVPSLVSQQATASTPDRRLLAVAGGGLALVAFGGAALLLAARRQLGEWA
jgi:hypothetical protein